MLVRLSPAAIACRFIIVSANKALIPLWRAKKLTLFSSEWWKCSSWFATRKIIKIQSQILTPLVRSQFSQFLHVMQCKLLLYVYNEYLSKLSLGFMKTEVVTD